MTDYIVEIDLKRKAAASKVLLNGVDISNALTGIDLRARVDEITQVTLFILPTAVKITGEVDKVDKVLQSVKLRKEV